MGKDKSRYFVCYVLGWVLGRVERPQSIVTVEGEAAPAAESTEWLLHSDVNPFSRAKTFGGSNHVVWRVFVCSCHSVLERTVTANPFMVCIFRIVLWNLPGRTKEFVWDFNLFLFGIAPLVCGREVQTKNVQPGFARVCWERGSVIMCSDASTPASGDPALLHAATSSPRHDGSSAKVRLGYRNSNFAKSFIAKRRSLFGKWEDSYTMWGRA